MTAFFTVGHSTHTLDAFVAMLKSAGIERVADIRKIPMSRTNPQFNSDSLPAALETFGIGYEHVAALGGRRGRTKGEPPDVNGFWSNRSFHNYADYALTEGFRAGLDRLLDLAERERCAIMCAEAVWWRCHRRIIADYLLVRDIPVLHLMWPHRIEPASLTPGAVPRGASVTYPAA